MDEAIECKCGSTGWVIGTSGTRCFRCSYWLPDNSVVADVLGINEMMPRDEKPTDARKGE